MSDLDYITVGDIAAFEASPGLRDWMRRRKQHAERPGRPGGSVERKPRPACGAAAFRLATRRRDLDLRDAEAHVAVLAAATSAVSLKVEDNGHFYAQADFDGRSVRMMVDTGATVCCLAQDDAERLGIRLRAGDFTWRMSTQNGHTVGAPISIASLRIGAITMRNVEGVVLKRAPGSKSLLGMSFLRRLRECSMESGRLTLRG